jgi:hypothetical protein
VAIVTNPATDLGVRTIAKLIAATRRPKVRPHRICAWCSKLLYSDGRAREGTRLHPSAAHDRGVSSGICRTCLNRELRHYRTLAREIKPEWIFGSDDASGDLMEARA